MMYWETIAKGKMKSVKNQFNDIGQAIVKGEYQHSNVSLDIELNAPVLIIPENIYLSGCNFVRLDTGFIHVSSSLRDYDEYKMNKQQMEKCMSDGGSMIEELDLYDQYNIKLTKMKLELVCPSASKSEP